jgi:hypothetical protein
MATPDWLENALRRHDLEIPTANDEQFTAVADAIKQGRCKCYALDCDFRKNGMDNAKFRFQVWYPQIEQAGLCL